MKHRKKRQNLLITSICILLFFYTHLYSNITMQFFVHVPKLISDGSIAQYDVFGTGIGKEVFTLILVNTSNTAVTNLMLRYKVDYFYPKSNSTQIRKQPLYEGHSLRFHLDSLEYFMIKSKDFLNQNSNSKARLSSTDYELESGELRGKITSGQKIPDGTIRYTMILEGINIPNVQFSDHLIKNANFVNLISPGSIIGGDIKIINDQHPLFIWNSDLIGTQNDLFEIRIYEARVGQLGNEVLNNNPILKEHTNTTIFKYPNTGIPLREGYIYYWEVIGKTTANFIKSSPFCFKFSTNLNSEILQVINILKQYPKEYNEDILKQVENYDKSVTIKVSGEGRTGIISVDSLRRLVQEFISGEKTTNGTRVE